MRFIITLAVTIALLAYVNSAPSHKLAKRQTGYAKMATWATKF